MTTTIPRVVLYARVSLQDGKSESVDQQLTAMRAEVARRGWSIVRELTDDGVSASKYARKERDGWAGLLRMVSAREVDIVAVWELSRLSRDLSTFALFRDLCEDHGVRWLTPGGIVDPASDNDRLGLGVQGLLNEQSSRETSKRVTRAMEAGARAGKPHGKHSYGYVRRYGANRELLSIEVEPHEADVLRWLATELLKGASMRGLIRTLNDRGEPAPAQAIAARVGREVPSGEWEGRTVKRLLTSPAYAGLRQHRGEVVGAAAWPALWDEAQHRRLVAVLRDPARGEARGTELIHWLSGVLFCEACEKPLRMLANPKRNYSGYTCVTPKCHSIAISKKPVEAEITSLVLAAARDRKFLRSDVRRIESLRAEVAVLRDRLAEAEAEFVAGRLSAGALARVEGALTAQIGALSHEVDRAEVPVDLPTAPVLAARWSDMEPTAKRHVTTLALGRVIVRSASKTRGVPVMHRLRFPDLEPVLGDQSQSA